MPLSEFLRMVGRKTESGQQQIRPSPTDLSSRSENDLVELVWENGEIMMQGQSSRVTRSPLPPPPPPARKFGGVGSVLNDMSPPLVPSGDLDLRQDDDDNDDDEMGPWLDALAQDYSSVLLPPEISITAANGIGMSTQNQNSFISCSPHTVTNLHSGGGAGGSYKPPSSLDARFLGSWLPPPQHRQTSDALGSGGVSGIISNNNTSFVFGNPDQGRDIVNDSTRQNIGPPNSSSFLNFAHFARPANLVKTKAPNLDQIPTSVVNVKEKGSAGSASGINPVGVKATYKDSCPPERTENEKPLIVSNTTADSTKGERVVELIVPSSSVGSGNSADRVSCQQTHNSKRKIGDTEDSECPSDDVETESIGFKKPTTARGSGSKRSRAADVHNLSERVSKNSLDFNTSELRLPL